VRKIDRYRILFIIGSAQKKGQGMTRLKIIFGIIFILPIIFSQISYSQGFLVTPIKEDLSCISPGKIDFTLRVFNSGSPGNFRVYPLGIQQERDGSLKFVLSSPPTYSCSEWITIHPSVFSLTSGQQKEIICTINIPPGQSGDKYAAIVTEQVIGKDKGKEFPIRVRIATLVRVRILEKDVEPRASISKIQTKNIDDFPKRIKLICSVKNESKVQINAKVKVKIVGQKEEIFSLAHLRGGGGTILPFTTRDFTGEIRRPASIEKFKAIVTLPYTHDNRGKTLITETHVPLTALVPNSFTKK